MKRYRLIGVWDARPRTDRSVRPGLLCTMENVPRLFPNRELAQAALDIFLKNTGDDPGHYTLVDVVVETI